MSDQRQIPYNLQAEESVIGAALINPRGIGPLAGYLDAGDFYKPLHQHVWHRMVTMYANGEPIDTLTVAAGLGDIDAGYVTNSATLMEMVNATPSISNMARYAEFIVETARRRHLIAHYASLIDDCYEHDADTVLDNAREAEAMRGLGRRKGAEVKGLLSLGPFIEHANSKEVYGEWLVPHIFRPRWRCILVAGEGIGKGTLMRYLGLHAAAGRDPWAPSRFIEPKRVLYIDAENSDTTILHQVNVANIDVDFVDECEDRYWIWRREEGLNLRDRRVQAEMEAVLQAVRPDIVFAGPLYKLTRRAAREDLEQGTLEMLEVLDDFRARYNFALMLEHHAPKGPGTGFREMNPFGSSALLRWPEFGLTLEEEGNPLPSDKTLTLKIGRFRRDREPADWPDFITRGAMGQTVAWVPRWVNGRNSRKL